MSRSDWDSASNYTHESDDDDEHIITFNLNTHQRIAPEKQSTTTNLGTTSAVHQHEYSIAASTVHTPGDGEARRLRFITRSPQAIVEQKHAAKTGRWL
jgi:hypothetical protein